MPVDIRYLERELDDVAIIVRLDNPRLTSVIAEFTETVQLLSQKPESVSYTHLTLPTILRV